MPVWNTGLCPLLKSSSHWRGERITFPKPKLIGGFSVKENQELVDSLKNMRYLCLPKGVIHWDLNTGFKDHCPTEKNERKLDNILKFIQTYPDKVTLSGDVPDKGNKIISPDFVCSRGFLANLMKTPYPKKENRLMAAYPQRDKTAGWNVLATKFRGTIYLRWIDEWIENKAEDAETRRIIYYGHKFRQLITTHEPNKPSSINDPVVREKFSGVFDTQLGKHRLLYAGEIFGFDSEKALDDHADLSEASVKIIQMHLKMNNMKLENFLRNKLLHWWCKTSLLGAETVYAGIRTHPGILVDIEEIPVKDMPAMGASQWSDAVCLNFCGAFLDLVKDKMKDVDDPETLYKFTYNPTDSDQVQYEILPSNPETFVLPSWYIDFLDELAAQGPSVKEG